ncbi:hypothetical protein G6F57_009579 [Rhizopus arrhizus]|uniref:C2 domain-containing protein n=1 Tax=Rhizopus oryzae TaxID=64495 RepID=A0A9P6WY37_RHIOR|nr:hypothetical protein G6F23_011589 [Rhizopus arrhizus]KAG0754715.1 hypothetical protein G6F24_012301 [Rhizopus arrhizus]KAG0791036.1 hypothetical protein G6F21_005377 [Rhizopus arrhizus]KAG0816988.1 hypothetical protein G6F20_002753 [Rhizopus arrhizus]KAG0825025.1 hypothetical protein G6F19_010026 [Rhizopus arrhizus]
MKRTKTDYGGGSYPIWDDQVNIPISHGPYQMRVQVFNKDMNPNHLMGEAVIDLAKVMREKEHDGYFPLMCRGQPSGEIYLELTFYLAKHAMASAQQPVRYQYPPNYQRPGPSIPQQLHRPPPPVPYQKPLPPRPNLTVSYSAPSHYALPTHRPAPYSMPPPSLSAPPLHILPSNPSAPHSLPMSPHYPMPPPLPQSMPMPHPRPLSPPQIFMSPTAPFLSPAVSRPQGK